MQLWKELEAKSHEVTWQHEREEEFAFVEDVTYAERVSMWKNIKPWSRGSASVEVHTCDGVACPNSNLSFKTTQLLFEMVHDVEGGRSSAPR